MTNCVMYQTPGYDVIEFLLQNQVSGIPLPRLQWFAYPRLFSFKKPTDLPEKTKFKGKMEITHHTWCSDQK